MKAKTKRYATGEFARTKEKKMEIARALGVETVPERYNEKFWQTCDELPAELPVTRRPLRSAIRTGAAVLATAAAAFILLVGMNVVNPVLAESLPGVGKLFQSWNNGPEEVTPVPVGSEADSESAVVSDAEQAAEPKPAAPVTASSNGSWDGELTVVDYSSDGAYLTMKMELTTGDPEFWKCAVVHVLTEGGWDPAALKVNGVEIPEENFMTVWWSGTLQGEPGGFFQNQEKKRYDLEWVVELPKRPAEKTELKVELALEHLTGAQGPKTDSPVYQVDPGFTAELTVEADPGNNQLLAPGLTDNGVKLLTVDSSSTYVKAELEIPYLGRLQYNLLAASQMHHHGNPEPLGVYVKAVAVKNGEETELYEDVGKTNWDYGTVNQDFPEESERPIPGTWVFTGPETGTEQVVLTVYEYLEDDPLQDVSATPIYTPIKNRVVAEFTLDLETGEVKTTEGYRERGLEKLDAAASREEVRHASFTNGYYAAGSYTICDTSREAPETFRDVEHVTVYGEDLSYRPLELRCYRNGEWMTSLKTCPEEDYNALEGEVAALPYYESPEGQYWEETTQPIYTQKEYRKCVFAVYYPEGMHDNTVKPWRFDRMELVDTETGKVLIEDIRRTYWQEFDEIFGTNQVHMLFEQDQLTEAEREAVFGTGEESHPGPSEMPVEGAVSSKP